MRWYISVVFGMIVFGIMYVIGEYVGKIPFGFYPFITYPFAFLTSIFKVVGGVLFLIFCILAYLDYRKQSFISNSTKKIRGK